MVKKAKEKTQQSTTHNKARKEQTQQYNKKDNSHVKHNKRHHNDQSADSSYDHQYRSFAAQLSSQQLKLLPIIGDGNCLFRSIADQCCGDQHQHLKYREIAMEEIQTHPQHYLPFLDRRDDNESDKQIIGRYVTMMGKAGEWGGHLELVALSRALHTTIVLHQLAAPRLVIQETQADSIYSSRLMNDIPTHLHLAYHDEQHYSSIRNIADDLSSIQIPSIININIIPSSSSSSSSSRSSSAINGIEKMIMKRSGCEDIGVIRQCLEEMAGDSESVIVVLKAMKQQDIPVENNSTAATTSTCTSISAPSSSSSSESTATSKASPGMTPKDRRTPKERRLAQKVDRVTAKKQRDFDRALQRKKEREKEKAEQQQETTQDKSSGTSVAAVTQDLGSLLI